MPFPFLDASFSDLVSCYKKETTKGRQFTLVTTYDIVLDCFFLTQIKVEILSMGTCNNRGISLFGMGHCLGNIYHLVCPSVRYDGIAHEVWIHRTVHSQHHLCFDGNVWSTTAADRCSTYGWFGGGSRRQCLTEGEKPMLAGVGVGGVFSTTTS